MSSPDVPSTLAYRPNWLNVTSGCSSIICLVKPNETHQDMLCFLDHIREKYIKLYEITQKPASSLREINLNRMDLAHTHESLAHNLRALTDYIDGFAKLNM